MYCVDRVRARAARRRAGCRRRRLVAAACPGPTRVDRRRLQRRLMPVANTVRRGRRVSQQRLQQPHARRALGRPPLVAAVGSRPGPRTRHIQLFGVSCSSSSACAAVGSYENRSGTTVTLAERWDGRRWSLQTVPDPRGAKAICSESRVLRAGRASRSVRTRLAPAVPSRSRSGGTQGAGRFCAFPIRAARAAQGSKTGCRAPPPRRARPSAPTPPRSGSTVTLAERLTGSRWSIQSVPDPAGGKNVELGAVSCLQSTALCTAVGVRLREARSGKGVTLAGAMGPSSLVDPERPDPPARSTPRCRCSVPVKLVVHGSQLPICTQTQKTVTLAERWDGRRWSLQKHPRPPWHPARELRRSLLLHQAPHCYRRSGPPG